MIDYNLKNNYGKDWLDLGPAEKIELLADKLIEVIQAINTLSDQIKNEGFINKKDS